MDIEYEATFLNIDVNSLKSELGKLKAKLIKPDFLQKRTIFDLPKGKQSEDTWLRLRDEGDKKTLTLKQVTPGSIEGQKEILVTIDNLESAADLLEMIGCKRKSYQESKREIWDLEGVEIAIDTWPFLDPYVEIEGNSEEDIKKIAELLGFDYGSAFFGTVNDIYEMVYGKKIDSLEKSIQNNFSFDIKNPFI